MALWRLWVEREQRTEVADSLAYFSCDNKFTLGRSLYYFWLQPPIPLVKKTNTTVKRSLFLLARVSKNVKPLLCHVSNLIKSGWFFEARLQRNIVILNDHSWINSKPKRMYITPSTTMGWSSTSNMVYLITCFMNLYTHYLPIVLKLCSKALCFKIAVSASKRQGQLP